MGDVVCSIPLCAAARKKHPSCYVIFVTNLGLRKLVELSEAADAVFGSKIWCWPFRFSEKFQFLGLIEAVYVPLNTDEQIPGRGVMLHLVDDLARGCGLEVKNRQTKLYLKKSFVSQTLEQFGLNEHKCGQKLFIAMNGGPTWPVRMWQTKNWQELVKRIHEQYDAEILLLGQMQGERGRDLMEIQGVTSLFDGIQPEKIAAILKACDLLVAIDSGPIHIAGAVGTPVVGLFGAVNPQFRMPPDSLGKSIVGNVSCLYCNHRIPVGHWIENCPHEIACMKAITVDEVFQAVKEILEKNPKVNFAKR
jgi:ADP-heptose:LPS heptosyltransferase